MVSLLKHDLELLFITPDKGRSLSTKFHNLRREMATAGHALVVAHQGCRTPQSLPQALPAVERSKVFREPTPFQLM